MADVLWITNPLATVLMTAAPTFQSLDSAIDVSAYDELYLQTFLIDVEAPVNPTSIVVNVWTSMENFSLPFTPPNPITAPYDNSWVKVFTNTFSTSGYGNATTGLAYNLLTKGTFQRYLLWEVHSISNASSVSLWIAGVGRSYAH